MGQCWSTWLPAKHNHSDHWLCKPVGGSEKLADWLQLGDQVLSEELKSLQARSQDFQKGGYIQKTTPILKTTPF